MYGCAVHRIYLGSCISMPGGYIYKLISVTIMQHFCCALFHRYVKTLTAITNRSCTY